MKILVIGDSCKDIFIYGDIERIAPEAPVPVIKPENKTENPGMSLNVVANLKALKVEVDVLTNEQEIRKIRYVDSRSNQMVLRVDENDKCERYDGVYDVVDYDAIIISDYCKGFLTEDDIAAFAERSTCPVFLDTKKKLGEWCRDIDFIKINDLEHRKNFETIPNYPMLQDKLIITQGPKGCIHKGVTYPVKVVPVKDVSGAGDTFMAGLVVEYIRSQNVKDAINYAQECTTVVVQKSGVATI
jgi:bifunctional ADP-heptose synthase (sugar kinase/adenylyltransferase)